MEEYATVKDGVVTALKEGIASIEATAGDVSTGCRIIIQKANGGDGKIEVTSIKLNKGETTIVTGLSEQLEVVELLPENATEKTVVWESSNPAVALVIERDVTANGKTYRGGLVTGRDPGEAIITARAGVASAQCKVTVTSGGTVTIESITIDPASVNLTVDEEKILTAVVKPAGAKANIVWEIDNQKIAAVGQINQTQAKVQGLSAGKATVTARAEGKTATCEVNVTGGSGNVQVQSITLDKTSLKLEVGQSAQITATVLPENAHDKSITWTTTDPYNAYVNGGKVTGYGVCEATITATSVSNPQVTATCKVSIVAAGSGGGNETGIEAVDLGLSSGLKWGSMNVGASSPEGYGDFYAWGETSTKTNYFWSTYKYGQTSWGPYSKYESSTDRKTVLEPADDAARVKLGGTWRTPTKDEWTELRTKCTWTWTTRNGIKGRLVTGSNGKSIFLPAAGYKGDNGLTNQGSYGCYWSATLAGITGMAWIVDFTSSAVTDGAANLSRCCGASVRPVMD